MPSPPAPPLLPTSSVAAAWRRPAAAVQEVAVQVVVAAVVAEVVEVAAQAVVAVTEVATAVPSLLISHEQTSRVKVTTCSPRAGRLVTNSA